MLDDNFANFAWASAPIYHLAWQGTFTSWALDPTRVSPVAHAVRDAHFAHTGCIRRWIDGVHAIHLRTTWALSLSLGQSITFRVVIHYSWLVVVGHQQRQNPSMRPCLVDDD